jgi:glycosyltransferase involved in cell wall biosynthesis
MTLEQPLFTVFTPTYNRAHTLHRVHQSLVDQTMTDFEWLVVDDGSTDDTRNLVRLWQDGSAFPIRYLYQPNSGMHIAFNRGVDEARGQLFLRLDSDDACVPEALARFRFHWESIPAEVRPLFSAVTSLCQDQAGRVVGDRFPFDPTDSDPLEIRLKYRVRGEKWGFHRTDVLREFPFPDLPGQPYVTESVVWNRIAKKFRTRYVNELLKIYFVEDGEDSLTARSAFAAELAPMFAMSAQQSLNDDLSWFRSAPLAFVKDAANYARYSFHCGRSPIAQSRALNPPARVLHALALPLGGALYMRDAWRRATAARAQPRPGAIRDRAPGP